MWISTNLRYLPLVKFDRHAFVFIENLFAQIDACLWHTQSSLDFRKGQPGFHLGTV